MEVQIFHLTMPMICRRVQKKKKLFWKITCMFHSVFAPFHNYSCFCGISFASVFPKSLVATSMIFYGTVTESALKLKSLLVFREKMNCNHKRQMNSSCLILILSEHWVSKYGCKATCIGDVLHLEDTVTKSCWWFLIKRRPVSQLLVHLSEVILLVAEPDPEPFLVGWWEVLWKIQ